MTFSCILGVLGILTVITYLFFKQSTIDFYQGERLYQKKEFALSIPPFQKAFKGGYRTRQLVAHLGDSLTAGERFDDAAHIYSYYLDMHPEDKEMHLRLARVLMYQKHYKQAEVEYEKSLQNSE